MKRSPSASHSYLRRLAEPAPPRTALLTTHRPTYFGQSMRDAIPPILDSIFDPATASPDTQRAAPRASLIPRGQTQPSQAFAIDASNQFVTSTARVATNAPPVAEADSTTSITGESHATERRPPVLAVDKIRPHPTGAARDDLAALSEALNPESNSRSGYPRQNPTAATAEHFTSAASSRNEPMPVGHDLGSRVHIGSIEVRNAPPVREPQPTPRIDRHSHTGRSALAAEPLARPLAWSHGLVQG